MYDIMVKIRVRKEVDETDANRKLIAESRMRETAIKASARNTGPQENLGK
jgi:hypothetical protein